MTDQGSDGKSFFGGDIPTNHKEAVYQFAESRTTRTQPVSMADILREAVSEYLNNHYDELPGETRDLLDEDLIANAGGTDE